jgi:hypothetical protein
LVAVMEIAIALFDQLELGGGWHCPTSRKVVPVKT